jgi:hypothetical protein
MNRFARLVLLGITLTLVTGAASAEPRCRKARGFFEIQTFGGPECPSEVGQCAAGVLRGTLRGTNELVGTSLVTTVQTPTSGVLLLTGDNVIHTDRGDLYSQDAILFAVTGEGEFSEVDTFVGGTGAYAGATGRLVATGTMTDGVVVGSYEGEVCVP